MTRRMTPMIRIGSNIQALTDDNVGSIAWGKAPAMRVSENVPINPIIVNNTPNIIRFVEVSDILIDPLQRNMNVWGIPLF